MILNFPWWHLIAAGFLFSVGFGLGSSVYAAVRGAISGG